MAREYSSSSRRFIIAFVFCINIGRSQSSSNEKVIQVLEDKLDAENFTYYRLQRDGNLRLELTSLKGDVDIYTSSEYQYPSYSEYDLKSDTCGIDIVYISENTPRPVYIAIYGHPNYLKSKFRLVIYSSIAPKVDTYEDMVAKYEHYYFDQVDKSNENEGRKSKSESKKVNAGGVEDDQPLWVKILLGIIEFGIDVIL